MTAMDDDRLARIEEMLVRICALLDKFEPMLERFSPGRIIPFSRRKD